MLVYQLAAANGILTTVVLEHAPVMKHARIVMTAVMTFQTNKTAAVQKLNVTLAKSFIMLLYIADSEIQGGSYSEVDYIICDS